MAKMSLRTAAMYCLVIWAAIWLVFLLIRVSPLDIRIIPGIGPIMLLALVVALASPIVAMGLAVGALFRQVRASLNWVIFGCAIAALIGQVVLFTITGWL